MALIILAIFFFLGLVGISMKALKPAAYWWEVAIGILYFLGIILSVIGSSWYSSPYYEAIDIMLVEGYSPFSIEHALTLYFYFLAFNISVFLAWTRHRKLPPLILAIAMTFLLIGIFTSVAVLCQTSFHDQRSLDGYLHTGIDNFFSLTPILMIVIAMGLLYQVISEEASEASERTYANKYLNMVNSFLARRHKNPIWIILLLLPVFAISTLVLVLLGQETDAIIKVFTDTTTWRFSQKMHPPPLDHTGHYLCTVAAMGHPAVVKPLRIGVRHGKEIIVNRQLLVANAFEEMIQDHLPKTHSVIRGIYDQYGYNLSRKVNSQCYSNITYLLMKPLEYFFLFCLYLFCQRPEQKIDRQYRI